MKKPSFVNTDRPLAVAMIIEDTANKVIAEMCNALAMGADAVGIQLESLKPEFRTEEKLKNIFYHAAGRPIYVTDYRTALSADMTDEDRAEELLLAVRCGATLADIPGDFFHEHVPDELTVSDAAIDKQRALIDKIHELGGEVLMSSHVRKFLDSDRTLAHAAEQKRRGADVCKFVTGSFSEYELNENFKTAMRLKQELGAPFLFLSAGEYSRKLRLFGPFFGVCMWLGVARYDDRATFIQPSLADIIAIRDAYRFY